MKRGQIVAVCHNGKWGRRVKGEVVATRQGHHIKVRFPNPDTGAPLEFWARVSPIIHYTRKTRKWVWYDKRYKTYGGWIDGIDVWSPWYSVTKWKEEFHYSKEVKIHDTLCNLTEAIMADYAYRVKKYSNQLQLLVK